MIFKQIERIIYPRENGTHKWYKRTRWDVKVGNTKYYFYDYNTIRVLEFLIELDKE